MFTFIEKNPRKVLAGVAILFALVYSVLAFKAGLVFNSPDENANYFFSSLFASESRLDYPLLAESDIVHPRSMTVVDKKIVPQSFIGLPILYGIFGKVFGSNAIIFFTPIIAVISVLFFYEIIKKVFGNKNAFLSSILVFAHPSFWYYSTHSMYHNVLFVSFFIIGVYFFVKIRNPRTVDGTQLMSISKEWSKNDCNEKAVATLACGANAHVVNMLSRVATALRANKNLILGSLFVGLALTVRLCEAPWVFLILIILFSLSSGNLIKFFQEKFKQIAICFFVFLIVFLPILFFDNYLYGSPFSSGYNLTSSAVSDFVSSPARNLISKSVFFDILRNFWNYGIYIFWWLSIPSILGFVLFFKKYKNLTSEQKRYLTVFLVGLFYLVIYYGSWVFHDNPDPAKITIGTSYVRYWLPIYIFSMPALAELLLKVGSRVKGIQNPRGCWTPLVRKIVFLCILGFLISYNFLFVFKLTDESIGRNVLGEYKHIREIILDTTEDNAIIVSGYYDKLFFPYRMVIENFNEERDKRLKEMKGLLESGYPLYYYSWNSDADIEHLNNIFKDYELKLVDGRNIREGERLFGITKTHGL